MNPLIPAMALMVSVIAAGDAPGGGAVLNLFQIEHACSFFETAYVLGEWLFSPDANVLDPMNGEFRPMCTSVAVNETPDIAPMLRHRWIVLPPAGWVRRSHSEWNGRSKGTKDLKLCCRV